MKRRYIPSLILAAGTVGGTLISVLTSESGWLVLGGPVFLTGAVVAARVVERRMCRSPGTSIRTALLLGAIYVVAGAIMFMRDPSQVALMMACLGGVSIVALGTSGERR